MGKSASGPPGKPVKEGYEPAAVADAAAESQFLLPHELHAEEDRSWDGHLFQCFGRCDKHGCSSAGLVYCLPCVAFGLNMRRGLVLSAIKQAFIYGTLIMLSWSLHAVHIASDVAQCPPFPMGPPPGDHLPRPFGPGFAGTQPAFGPYSAAAYASDMPHGDEPWAPRPHKKGCKHRHGRGHWLPHWMRHWGGHHDHHGHWDHHHGPDCRRERWPEHHQDHEHEHEHEEHRDEHRGKIKKHHDDDDAAEHDFGFHETLHKDLHDKKHGGKIKKHHDDEDEEHEHDSHDKLHKKHDDENDDDDDDEDDEQLEATSMSTLVTKVPLMMKPIKLIAADADHVVDAKTLEMVAIDQSGKPIKVVDPMPLVANSDEPAAMAAAQYQTLPVVHVAKVKSMVAHFDGERLRLDDGPGPHFDHGPRRFHHVDMEQCEALQASMGHISAALIMYFIFLAIYAARRRTELRERFNIAGSKLGDLFAWFCCPSCALCQETRTLAANNVEAGVWRGRVPAEGVQYADLAAVAPPVHVMTVPADPVKPTKA